MGGPGAYVPAPTEGLVHANDLPLPLVVPYDRQHAHSPCPRCGPLAYRHKSRCQAVTSPLQGSREGEAPPAQSATNRQSLFMPPSPCLMPSSAHRAQGIVKNVNPLSTKTLGSMSGGMKYMPGTTP